MMLQVCISKLMQKSPEWGLRAGKLSVLATNFFAFCKFAVILWRNTADKSYPSLSKLISFSDSGQYKPIQKNFSRPKIGDRLSD
jgi:hypothetical protein